MWRKLTENDLVSALSRKEVDAFRSDFAIDPVPVLLADTASWARGFIRSNGNVRMDPDELSLPASCVSPAMDYAVVQVLKRFNIEPNKTRQQARKDAIEFFASIARGDVNPESWNEPAEVTTGGPSIEVVTSVRPRVTARKLEGL